jgi:hypothetical protein
VLYARFIRDSVDDIFNQLIETTLAKDRDFVAWRAENLFETVARRAPTESPTPPATVRPSVNARFASWQPAHESEPSHNNLRSWKA